MGHIVIIIDGQPTNPPHEESLVATPASSTAAQVRYTPSDEATPEQIANEVARYVRKVNRIVDGGDDA